MLSLARDARKARRNIITCQSMDVFIMAIKTTSTARVSYTGRWVACRSMPLEINTGALSASDFISLEYHASLRLLGLHALKCSPRNQDIILNCIIGLYSQDHEHIYIGFWITHPPSELWNSLKMHKNTSTFRGNSKIQPPRISLATSLRACFKEN